MPLPPLPPLRPAGVPAAATVPAGPPTVSPIPDISGRDGEQLALALQSGAGAGPALAKATQWEGVAAQVWAAHAALTGARTQLLASGEAAMSGPLMTRLDRAIGWAQGAAAHASALGNGYTVAAGSYTTTTAAVGHPAVWRATKVNLAAARADPFGQPRAHAYHVQLTGMQQSAGVSMTGYQTTGTALSTPPGTLPDPGLAPNTPSVTGPTPGDGDKQDKFEQQDPKAPTSGDEPDDPASPMSGEGSGLQEMLGPLMGALGPLMESLGQANPLQSLGQLGQQMGQQAGNLAKAATSPLKPATLAQAHPAGGAHKGGGGSPIKPAASLSGAIHPASLTGTPPASAPAAPIKPAAAAGASPSGAGGMGMVPPMGRRSGEEKSSKVHSYEQPMAEVEAAGRPGVVGAAAKPEPVVNPESHAGVKARMAARKKDVAGDDA